MFLIVHIVTSQSLNMLKALMKKILTNEILKKIAK